MRYSAPRPAAVPWRRWWFRARRAQRAQRAQRARRSGQDAAIGAFFTDLAARGHDPALTDEAGTLRFDIRDGQRVTRWFVAVDDGDVAVSRRRRRADTVVHVRSEVMHALVTGRITALAAALRGDLIPNGDVRLLLQFQRCLPRRASPV